MFNKSDAETLAKHWHGIVTLEPNPTHKGFAHKLEDAHKALQAAGYQEYTHGKNKVGDSNYWRYRHPQGHDVGFSD